MSKNENPKKLSPKKNKNFTTHEGNFLSDFSRFFSISPSPCSVFEDYKFLIIHFNINFFIIDKTLNEGLGK